MRHSFVAYDGHIGNDKCIKVQSDIIRFGGLEEVGGWDIGFIG